MNKEEFDLSGITAWHKAGYTGKGIRIGNLEGTDPQLPFFDGKVKDPFGIATGFGRNYHGHQTADILHQVATDATIYTLSDGGSYGAGKASGRFIEESIPYMEDHGIHLVNASLGGTANEVLRDRIRQAQETGVTFVTSAGNEAEQGVGGYARSGAWIAVGAVTLSDNGTILHAPYSSVGEDVDFTQFSSIYVHDATDLRRTFPVSGTSFSSPMLCGMLALVQQLFVERAGRTLHQDELYEFMIDHSIDLWEPGKDTKSGYGLFLLPDPDTIDVWQYVGREEESEVNNPEYIIIHHSATKQGSAEVFRKNHMEVNGWRDVGYHYVIGNDTYSGDGEIERGRTEYEAGAHCKADGMNNKSIGVCLVGDFRVQKPTVAQMQALEKLCQDIMKRHDIPPSKVLGHGEVKGAATDCPGRYFDINAFRKELVKVDKKDYEGHWAKVSIDKAKASGVMSGYPDGTFKPDQPVTRAELAAVLDRLGLLEVR